MFSNTKTEIKQHIEALQTCLGILESMYPDAPTTGTEPVHTIRAAVKIDGGKNGKRAAAKPIANPPHATNKTERSADGKSKVCHGCGAMKLVDEYPKNRVCSDGHAGTCLECTRKRSAKSYAESQKRKRSEAALQTKIMAPAATDPGVIAKGLHCACGKSFATRPVFMDHQEKCEKA